MNWNYITISLMIVILFFSCFVLGYAYNVKKEITTETKIIEVNLVDNNYIYKSGNILGFICDDNVYYGKVNYYFSKIIPFGKDFLYLSTWRDGNIPHSTGKCYIKVIQKKEVLE